MLVVLCLTIPLLLFGRLIYIYMHLGKQKSFGEKKTVKLLAIAGSGGHTSELIRVLAELPPTFCPRHYVIAATDSISEKKLVQFESKRKFGIDAYSISKIPRSREVAQSWSSTVYTTLVAFLYSLPLMWKCKPDVILCNGPGTCIPICITGLLFKLLGICWTEIIYVESICRVTTMSMSGIILYPFADMFYIQWPPLLEQYPKAIYLGGRVV